MNIARIRRILDNHGIKHEGANFVFTEEDLVQNSELLVFCGFVPLVDLLNGWPTIIAVECDITREYNVDIFVRCNFNVAKLSYGIVYECTGNVQYADNVTFIDSVFQIGYCEEDVRAENSKIICGSGTISVEHADDLELIDERLTLDFTQMKQEISVDLRKFKKIHVYSYQNIICRPEEITIVGNDNHCGKIDIDASRLQKLITRDGFLDFNIIGIPYAVLNIYGLNFNISKIRHQWREIHLFSCTKNELLHLEKHANTLHILHIVPSEQRFDFMKIFKQPIVKAKLVCYRWWPDTATVEDLTVVEAGSVKYDCTTLTCPRVNVLQLIRVVHLNAEVQFGTVENLPMSVLSSTNPRTSNIIWRRRILEQQDLFLRLFGSDVLSIIIEY